MDMFNKDKGEGKKDVQGFKDTTPKAEEGSTEETTEETTVEEGGAIAEEVTVEETVEEVVEEKVEEAPIEEDTSDYVALDKVELQKLREEVNQLFQKGKGKFNFKGLKIIAK